MANVETETIQVGLDFFLVWQLLCIFSLEGIWLPVFDHSVLVEQNERSLAVLVSVEGVPFLHIIGPVAFIS
jgi:hypothetical protein